MAASVIQFLHESVVPVDALIVRDIYLDFRFLIFDFGFTWIDRWFDNIISLLALLINFYKVFPSLIASRVMLPVLFIK